jgi:hypothetical protein
MENHNQTNKAVAKYDWVKNLYFYIILAGTILALGISSFILIYSSAVRFVFTDLQTRPYISYEQCKNNLNYYYSGPVTDFEAKKVSDEPKLSDQEQKDCANKQINTEYQQTLLSTSLAILVAGIILITHLYVFKFRKTAKTVEAKHSAEKLKD